MDRPSFISSSKAQIFLAAVVVVGICETGIRALPLNAKIAYRMGEEEFRTGRLVLDALPAKTVTFFGSSRVREALNLPVITDLCTKQNGSNCDSLGNFAQAGASAIDAMDVIEYAMQKSPPPQFAYYGVDPRALLPQERDYTRAKYYFGITRAGRAFFDGAYDSLPEMVRMSAGNVLQMIKYRVGITTNLKAAISSRFKADEMKIYYSNPMLGEASFWQVNLSKDVTILNNKKLGSPRRGANFFIKDGGLIMDDHQVQAIVRMAEITQSHGGTFVLFELALPPRIKRHFPDNAYSRYLQSLQQLSKQHGFRFVTNEDIGYEANDEDFREYVHHGWNGHLKFTHFFATNELLVHALNQPTK